MKRKLCMLLLGLCLVSVSACGDKAASGNANDIPAVSQKEESAESKETEENKASEENQEAEESGDSTADQEESQEGVEEPNVEDSGASQEAENEDASTNEELVDGMRPEFKEAMDSYEAFYDQYCDIMKKYKENPSDLTLIAEYTDILAKSADVSKKFEAWEGDDLNDAELNYYLEVQSRVTQKLLEVS